MLEEFSLDDEFDADIDLTPMIDVVFILLIFFFISSSFIRPSLPITMAHAESAATSAERRQQVVITIDAEGTLFNGTQRMERDEVPALLKAHPNEGINLFVDRSAPFEAFLSVVDEARLLHRDDLSITTSPARRE
ncbi:MAG: biopolymer transporter ExbD [Kiritimatiellaceae bacterium]|nr:biopolymer transporter ExbD [Kiritimatiellaceae bacterium]